MHVGTSVSISFNGSTVYGYFRNDAVSGTWFVNEARNISFIAENEILIKGNHILVSSDKRIKKNIRDIQGATALSQIRRIQPKVYNKIDDIYHQGDIYGFIAQDVEDVINNTSRINTSIIPNFYCKGDIVTIDQANHIYEISTKNEFKFEKILDASGNEISNYKIRIYDDKNKDYICTVIHRIDAKTIRVKCDKEYVYSTIEEYKNTVFIYGQEVHDFYNLDKNSIFTVATAALQEVDRQQQADKARIAELEATVASQQSLINDILERLKTNGM
ncbi:tail fiber domain-containing protein [bacterium]|nr:tail fiber domain-containing protein [bacterium]